MRKLRVGEVNSLIQDHKGSEEARDEIFSFWGQVSPTPCRMSPLRDPGVEGHGEDREGKEAERGGEGIGQMGESPLTLLEGFVGHSSLCPALNVPGPYRSLLASVSSPVNKTVKSRWPLLGL